MHFEFTSKPNAKDIHEIKSRVLEYNSEYLETVNERFIAIFVKTKDEIMVAGITGKIFGLWLEIEFLFVDEDQRGSGLGSKLLTSFEKEGMALGCRYAFLNTFDFQAKEFYLRYGYKLALELQNYPISGTNSFFTKELALAE